MDFSKLESLAPEPPEHLSGRALEAWTTLQPILTESGVAKDIDRMSLAMLCSSLGLIADADEHLATEGLTLTNDDGVEYPNPWAEIRAAELPIASELLRAFGLDPTDASASTLFPQIAGASERPM